MAVKVTFVPVQMVLSASSLNSVGAGKASTFIVISALVAVQPDAEVTITFTTSPSASPLVVYVFKALF